MASKSDSNLFEINYHKKKPNMTAKCGYEVTRESEKTDKVKYKFDFTVTPANSGEYYGSSNATGFKIEVDGQTQTCYAVGKGSSKLTASITFNATNKSSKKSGKYLTKCKIYIWCHQGTYANPSGTSNNCSAPGGPYNYTWSEDIEVPAYEPYTKPSSYTLNSATELGRVSSDRSVATNYTLNYTIVKGTNNVKWTRARLYYSDESDNWTRNFILDATSDKNKEDVNWSTTDKTKSHNEKIKLNRYNTNNYYKHGTKYKVQVEFNDGVNTFTTNKKNIYTYQEPDLDSVSRSTGEKINAITSVTFTLNYDNNRKWSEQGEAEFQSQYKTDKDNDLITKNTYQNLGNTKTFSLSAANLRKLVPDKYDKSVLSDSTVDPDLITLTFKRRSPTAKWDSTERTKTLRVSYVPRNAISSNSISYTKDSPSGSTININNKQYITDPDNYTSIYVKWDYDTSAYGAGYTQGYRVVLQYRTSSTSGWKTSKTYYTTNKYQEIKKADIPRIYESQVVITPYYKHNETDTSKYWYGISPTSVRFFTIVSPLSTPVIEYPINNTTWHNQDFRVCFKLPTDPDMAWLQTNEPTVANSYTYHNIEIKVDSNIYRLNDAAGYTDTGTKYVDMFSCIDSGLTYQAPVVVHATKHYSTTASSHTIQIRVKKLLGTTSGRTMWTGWSTSRTVKINHPTYNVTAIETIIQATHYNTLYDMISNISKVYNITWSNAPTKVTARTTIVDNSQYTYNSMIKVLADIKAKINNYATFNSSKTAVEMDSTNKLTSSADWNPKEKVLITAEKDKPNETWNNNYNQGKEGHNYIKWVYEQCDYLK